MSELREIRPQERPVVDSAKLDELFGMIGVAAEDMIYRAMEELALRMGQVEKLYVSGRRSEMRKNTRAMAAIAGQIGLTSVERIAGDVVTCIDDCDRIALAATFARLARVCEGSLTAMWDLQDLKV